jgi:hypothetical protein
MGAGPACSNAANSDESASTGPAPRLSTVNSGFWNIRDGLTELFHKASECTLGGRGMIKAMRLQELK